jgi:CRISPR-associated protein Cst2
MHEKPTLKQAKALTITFLTPVSLGSLNGSDKEADNLSSIKKLTRGTKAFPYVSSQAVRRALRDQLGVMGHDLSEGQVAKEKKGAAITKCLPAEYIDDDLFGFMDASKGGTHKRTSPVRVSPLLALDPYEGDIDFGTNYMSVDSGGNPNIFETEIHGGLYRGTLLIELDAVGKSREGEGVSASNSDKPWDLDAGKKAARVNALLSALQHLWSSGRQSRFLADISPKFVAAAALTAKVPIFLESVSGRRSEREITLDCHAIAEALQDSKKIIVGHCIGSRSGFFAQVPEGTKTVGEAFDTIRGWVKDHYGA